MANPIPQLAAPAIQHVLTVNSINKTPSLIRPGRFAVPLLHTSLVGSERGGTECRDLLGGSESWCGPRAAGMSSLCQVSKKRERARIQTHSTPSHFDHLRDARKSTRYARGSSAEHVEMETWGTTKRVSTGCRPGGDERGRQRM